MASTQIPSFFSLVLASILALLSTACVLKHEQSSENDGKSFKTADGVCHHVNPGSALHPVIFCERADELRLQVLERRFVFTKKDLEARIGAQLRMLTAATDIRPSWLDRAAVEVWVSAPVLAPLEAQLVVVVKAKGLGFAVFLPPEPAHWDFLSAPLVQLGAGGYPALQTWQAGQLVMVSERSIREADWQRFSREVVPQVGSNPAGSARVKAVSFAGEGVKFQTAIFSEAQVARQVQTSPLGKKYGLKPQWIPALEPDAYKAKGYSFSFSH